ncbi:MAG: SpoIIE family protein phosphatase [Treponema sp.]|nr:SpoIIE family protein phosphatase [Treponema sp.]
MGNKRTSFKLKVLIPIIAIFIVTVMFLSFIDYRMLNTVVRKKTNANLELFAENIFAQINHLNIILDSTKQTLDEKHIAIVKTILYILKQSDGEMTPDELQQLAQLLDIIELNIADRDGNLINSNIPEYIGDDYKTSETTIAYMLLADGREMVLSEEPRPSILPDGSSGEIVHFAGVAHPEGGFVQLGFNAGVIGRLQEQINIDRTIRETKIGDNGYGFVLSKGIITAHPDNNLLGKDVKTEIWYRDVESGSGFTWIQIDGKRYYAGYKNVNGNNVIGLVPHGDYYLELNRILFETIRVLGFAIVLIIIIVNLVLGKLLLPVKHLVKGLGKIAQSNLDARIEGNYNDEFDEIKVAVNSMAEDLKVHMNLVSGIEYASKIQRNLLPADSAFAGAFNDYNCIWKPKDIVGGDIYWMKNFQEGVVLCVCDCTGHGTPGALLSMLVASAFEAAVTNKNCRDTAFIIWELEKRLVAELNVNNKSAEKGLNINDGCDLAVLFIAKDGSVSISSGQTNVFVCDGEKVTRLRGQRIRIGDGALKSRDDVKVVNIPSNANNKYYIPSDGLYEQIGGSENLPFGFNRLEKIILENHEQTLNIISEKILQAFEEYRGDNPRRDDLQIISFIPRIES